MSPENIFKFCPRCGSGNFKPQNTLYDYKCNDCKFVYYLGSVAATAGIVYDSNNQILLTQRKIDPQKGLYDFPGGFVNVCESAENAVIREVKEELGLEVIDANYITSFPVKYTFSDLDVSVLTLYFELKVADLGSLKMDPTEIKSFIFKKLEDIELDKFAFEADVKFVEMLKLKDSIKNKRNI